jgi:hypothetical protein
MKTFILNLLILISSVGFAQTNQSPKYFLNGKEIDWDTVFINPKNIKSINIEKETPNGEIYIVTNGIIWKHKSLEKLLLPVYNNMQIYDKSITPIFVIEGKVINNPEVIEIDDTYFPDATLKSLSNVQGISGDCKKLVLVDIKLADDQKAFIRLRGTNVFSIDSLKIIKE